MSIDPLKAFSPSSFGHSRTASSDSVRQQTAPFERLLQAAESAPLSSQTLVREATEMVQTARLQMLQGLFSLSEESSDSSLLSTLRSSGEQINLSPQPGQKLDDLYAGGVTPQSSLLKPEQCSRGEIEQMIERVAKHVSLAPELIRSVVSAESDFTPTAVSSAGAQGLMQLMPATADELGVKDSFNPLQNLLGGSQYLKQLLDKYDGDLDQTLAAYNWGQGNLDRQGLDNMPQETRDYVARVKSQLGAESV